MFQFLVEIRWLISLMMSRRLSFRYQFDSTPGFKRAYPWWCNKSKTTPDFPYLIANTYSIWINLIYLYLLKRIRHFTTFWLMYLGCLKWYILQQIHENGFVCVVINCIDKSSATICIPQDTAAASTILHNSTTDTIFLPIHEYLSCRIL